MAQEKASRETHRTTEDEIQNLGELAAQSKEEKEKLDGEVDDILDEIDDVLESNAEEFVKSYIQKGGQ